MMMNGVRARGLSAWEEQVLQHLVVGSSNKAIARDLAISLEAVKFHLKAILRKLTAQRGTQAAGRGYQNASAIQI
jgi:two-component system nitrate/nitrite response regulator NarL